MYLLILLITLGLACQAVSDPIEESLGSGDTTESDEVEAPTVVEPTIDAPPTVEAPTGSTLADAIEVFEDVSQAHEEDPVYFDTDRPPPGGVHAPFWQNCGIYTEPVEAKNALHSLEHGAVWLTYDPDCQKVIFLYYKGWLRIRLIRF